MKTPHVRKHLPHLPRRVGIGLGIGWLLIAAKCTALPWLMARWQVPVNPGWVVIPTLIFAGLVTILVVTHDWQHDDEPRNE